MDQGKGIFFIFFKRDHQEKYLNMLICQLSVGLSQFFMLHTGIFTSRAVILRNPFDAGQTYEPHRAMVSDVPAGGRFGTTLTHEQDQGAVGPSLACRPVFSSSSLPLAGAQRKKVLAIN